MLTLKQLRDRRCQITETELWQRCKSAARLELRGKSFSSDDRDECAAKIMAQGLEDTSGSLPLRDSPRHTLSAYCGRAKNHRRSLEAQRARDDQQAMMELDQSAWADIEVDIYEPREIDRYEATLISAGIVRRLGMHLGGDVAKLFYRYVRDLPSADCAEELGMTVPAYDMACSRARVLVRAAYPGAVDFLDALAGGSTYWQDPMTQTAILRFVLHDDSSEAKHGPSRLLVRPWREGTDNGEYPLRPENRTVADSLCRCWIDAGTVAKTAARVLTLEAQSESLRNLGMALQRV
jgi:hypothetical protein